MADRICVAQARHRRQPDRVNIAEPTAAAPSQALKAHLERPCTDNRTMCSHFLLGLTPWARPALHRPGRGQLNTHRGNQQPRTGTWTIHKIKSIRCVNTRSFILESASTSCDINKACECPNLRPNLTATFLWHPERRRWPLWAKVGRDKPEIAW